MTLRQQSLSEGSVFHSSGNVSPASLTGNEYRFDWFNVNSSGCTYIHVHTQTRAYTNAHSYTHVQSFVSQLCSINVQFQPASNVWNGIQIIL